MSGNEKLEISSVQWSENWTVRNEQWGCVPVSSEEWLVKRLKWVVSNGQCKVKFWKCVVVKNEKWTEKSEGWGVNEKYSEESIEKKKVNTNKSESVWSEEYKSVRSEQ